MSPGFLLIFCQNCAKSRLITLDQGQTREICEKQENYFKGKVFIFTIQSTILKQYAVNVLTHLELY